MSAEQIDLSIVVPCYRSGDWLGELAEQVSAALEPSGLRFELLLVNDASGDETWNVIEEITGRRKRTLQRYLRVAQNPSIRGAVEAGQVSIFKAEEILKELQEALQPEESESPAP